MTKEEVIAKFGKPDRQGFHKSDDGVLYERFYYFDAWWHHYNVLEFEDNVLKSMYQEQEEQTPVVKVAN